MQSHDITTLLNQADSGTLIAQAGSVGSWQVLPYNSPILPVHAALLHTGRVFFYSGSGNDPNNMGCPNCDAVLEDINNGTFNQPTVPVYPDDGVTPFDIFCAGQSFLPDGRLCVVGGTAQYDPFYGLFSTYYFNPGSEQWEYANGMNSGRWYPTVMTLGDGRILAVSGLDENGNIGTYPEYSSDPQTIGWTAVTQPTSAFPIYPNLFLMQDGKVFYSGACFNTNNGVTPRILTIPSNSDPNPVITEQEVTGLQDADFSNQATSVLLPPAQNQKVMILGGGNSDGTATNRVNIVTLTGSNPTYTSAPYLNYARMHVSAVLLPDRTVFVCNGSKVNEDTTQSMLPAEIYNPATNKWTVVAQQTVPRVYHSVALLLPDGSVLTAGGNPERTVNELRLEIYSPAYMSQTRPVIQSSPQSTTYGQTFTIQTSQAANIKWVQLIKPSANTHSCDTEQRLVDVPIKSRTTNSLTVQVTTNTNLAPPGWYMLFITNKSNVPSVANWIQLR